MELWIIKNEEDLKNTIKNYDDDNSYIMDKTIPKEYPCCLVIHTEFDHNKDESYVYSALVYKSDF
ncbi:MAG: hypothetical protein ACOCVF_03990 [bacterium]